MFGGPDRTEAQLAAKDTLPKVLADVQAEHTGAKPVDLPAAYQSLSDGLAGLRKDGAPLSQLHLYTDETARAAIPNALFHAVQANPEVLPALGEHLGIGHEGPTAAPASDAVARAWRPDVRRAKRRVRRTNDRDEQGPHRTDAERQQRSDP